MSIHTHLLKGDGAALPCRDSGKQFRLKFTIDCLAVPITAADVVKLMIVPADVLVQDVVAVVRTAEGATLTFDIGDYTTSTDVAVDADGYIDGANGNSAAATKSSDQLKADTTVLGYAAGKVYTDALRYIGVLFNNDAAAAVIDVNVLCIPL